MSSRSIIPFLFILPCAWILWTRSYPDYLPGEGLGSRSFDWEVNHVFPDQESCTSHGDLLLLIAHNTTIKLSNVRELAHKVLCTPDTVDPRRTYNTESKVWRSRR